MDLETASAHMRSLVRIWREDDLSRSRRYHHANDNYRGAKLNADIERYMAGMSRHSMVIDLDSVTDLEMSRIEMMIYYAKRTTAACYSMIGILRSEMIQLNEIKKICSYVLSLMKPPDKTKWQSKHARMLFWPQLDSGTSCSSSSFFASFQSVNQGRTNIRRRDQGVNHVL